MMFLALLYASVVVHAEEINIENMSNIGNETVIIRGHRYVEDFHAAQVIVDGGFLEILGGYIKELRVINNGIVNGWVPVGKLYARNFKEIYGVEVTDSADIQNGEFVRIILSFEYISKNVTKVKIANVKGVDLECHFDACPWMPIRNNSAPSKQDFLSKFSKYVILEGVKNIEFGVLTSSIKLKNLTAPYLSVILLEKEARSRIEDSILDKLYVHNKYIIIKNVIVNKLTLSKFEAKNVTVRDWFEMSENNACYIDEYSMEVPRFMSLRESNCTIITNKYSDYHIFLGNTSLKFISKIPSKLYVKGWGSVTSSSEIVVEEGTINTRHIVHNVTIRAPKDIIYSVVCNGIESKHRGTAFIGECENAKILLLWLQLPISCSYCTYNLIHQSRILYFNLFLFSMIMISSLATGIAILVLSRKKCIYGA